MTNNETASLIEKMIEQNFKKTKLIGKYVFINDKESIYFQEWGRIVDFDGDVYYIAIADGADSIPIFDRSQFKVPHRQWLRYHADLIKERNAII